MCCTYFKTIEHSSKIWGPFRKTLRPSWCPKLVTGLVGLLAPQLADVLWHTLGTKQGVFNCSRALIKCYKQGCEAGARSPSNFGWLEPQPEIWVQVQET